MGVGVEEQLRAPCALGHADDVSVRHAVTLSCGHLEEDAVVGGEMRILGVDEAGVSEDVDVGGGYGGVVRARLYGFVNRLSVNVDDPRAHFTGSAGEVVDFVLGRVGDLDSRAGRGCPNFLRQLRSP